MKTISDWFNRHPKTQLLVALVFIISYAAAAVGVLFEHFGWIPDQDLILPAGILIIYLVILAFLLISEFVSSRKSNAKRSTNRH